MVLPLAVVHKDISLAKGFSVASSWFMKWDLLLLVAFSLGEKLYKKRGWEDDYPYSGCGTW